MIPDDPTESGGSRSGTSDVVSSAVQEGLLLGSQYWSGVEKDMRHAQPDPPFGVADQNIEPLSENASNPEQEASNLSIYFPLEG